MKNHKREIRQSVHKDIITLLDALAETMYIDDGKYERDEEDCGKIYELYNHLGKKHLLRTD